jgi:hypothetical protein
MPQYAIIETEEGLTVAEVPDGDSSEEVAASLGAFLIDGGPYDSYQDAYDAMMLLPEEDEDDETA